MSLKKTAFTSVIGLGLLLTTTALQAAESTVASLTTALKSADEAARLDAIQKLGSLGEGAAPAVAPLTEQLKDASAKVRAHAAWALGRIGPSAGAAIPALLEMLKDPDADVRRQAVEAAVRIHPGADVPMPLGVKVLEDADPGVRMRIMSAIAESGEQAVPGLIQILDNDNVAYWACIALREMGPVAKAAVPALTAKLKDSHPEIRREAILALGAMEQAAAVAAPQIAEALKDKDTTVAATFALGRIGVIPADVDALIRANTKSDDALLSTASLWTLARVHPEDKDLRRTVTERLVDRLKNPNPLIRIASARGLASLPPAPEITLPIWEKAFQNADETEVFHALDALASLGPVATPQLIEALKYEKLRHHVAYLLGQYGAAAAPATEALAALITDKNDRVAQAAILALANIGPGAKAAAPTLTAALRGGKNPDACVIALALGRIGPDAKSAAPALTALLAGRDRDLALTAAWALVHIEPASPELAAQTLPALEAGLAADRSSLSRRGAAEAIGLLGAAAKSAVPALQNVANDQDPLVRAAVEQAIQSINKAAP
ncbi:MAG: HEAT repeat domain-containing protein [Planctomycetaceae bacterium]|nr:HEAT repeat domain-containing protein [Planctomycetaceae bacterium]